MNENRRVQALDATRGFALLGMLLAHLTPVTQNNNTSLTPLGQVINGTSAALFLFCAGYSLQYIRSNTALAIRSALLILIGLTLASFQVSVAIILVNYGVLFLILLPLRKIKTHYLGILTGTILLLSPLISYWLISQLPQNLQGKIPQRPSFLSLQFGWQNLLDIFLTGYYPLLTCAVYVLAGMLLSRFSLGGDRRLLSIGLTGLICYIVPYFTSHNTNVGQLYGQVPTNSMLWLNTMVPHSGTTPEMVHNLGYCLVVFTLFLWIEARYPVVLVPLAAPGRIALSLYIIHCLLTIVTKEVWIHVLCLAIVTIFCTYYKKPGPFEYLITQVSEFFALLSLNIRKTR